MVFESLFSLLDDIVTVLDDVAAMSKVALKQTSGVVGDDLALNAEQASGVHSDRELPVVWAVAKGSIINKAILVPTALAISTIIPWFVTPLLMLGGAYLCFEGAEKVLHALFHTASQGKAKAKALIKAIHDPNVDMVKFEKEKIKGAIRTDFILSAEVIVISLGTVSSSGFGTKVGVLIVVALLMTLVVYGLVAGIVKLDDFGVWLIKNGHSSLGKMLLVFAPNMMRVISWLGLLAMFLVGGGILVHGFPVLESILAKWGAFQWMGSLGVGLSAGAVLAGLFSVVNRMKLTQDHKS